MRTPNAQNLELVRPGFYDRAAEEVAVDLLGRWLIREHPEGRVVAKIVEVEAYLGTRDPASHAYRGETPRNQVMFGAGGRLYVYLIYGIHHCANVVCGPAGTPHAVLLRGAEVVEGGDLAVARRGSAASAERAGTIAAGPGRLGQALAIDRRDNGTNLSSGSIRLAQGTPISRSQVVCGPRVGVDYAGAAATWPLRFAIAGHSEVSRPKTRVHLSSCPDSIPAPFTRGEAGA